MQTQEMPPEEAAPQDETADWRTYRNEKYKYEIKYPKEWEGPQDWGDSEFSTTSSALFFLNGPIWVLFINVYENFESLSPEEWWTQYFEKMVTVPTSYEGRVSISLGIEAEVYKIERTEFQDTCYLIPRDERIYVIYVQLFSEEEIQPILSTFKFIE
jgi:hypothetical protein